MFHLHFVLVDLINFIPSKFVTSYLTVYQFLVRRKYMKRWPVLGALYFMVNGFMIVFRVLPTCVVQLLLRSEGESSMLYSLLMSMWWRTSQSCQRYVQVMHHMLHLFKLLGKVQGNFHNFLQSLEKNPWNFHLVCKNSWKFMKCS